MLRLVRYLKPYILLILLNIVLLFGQANADLALPDYLSKIVNNGIQQGGVENAVPRAIRQSEMNRLFIFASAEDKALMLRPLHPGGSKLPRLCSICQGLSGSGQRTDLCPQGLGSGRTGQAEPGDGEIHPGGFHPRAGHGRPGQGRGDGARLAG